MRIPIAAVVAVAVAFVVVASCQPPAEPPVEPAGSGGATGARAAVPFPDPAGWRPAGEVSSHGADGLWQLINGAADQFLAYGFRQLRIRELEADGVRVTLQLYDMDEPLNAFGIFRTEAAGLDPRPIGAGAVVSPPYQALLAVDRFYVKVETLEGELAETPAVALLESLVAELPGSNGVPDAVVLLPEAGRVDGTVGYALDGLLGLDELDHCVHADYRDAGGATFTRFVLLPEEGEAAGAVWQQLAEVWRVDRIGGLEILHREIPYTGLVGIVPADGHLTGAAGAPDLDTLAGWLG